MREGLAGVPALALLLIWLEFVHGENSDKVGCSWTLLLRDIEGGYSATGVGVGISDGSWLLPLVEGTRGLSQGKARFYLD